MTLSMNNINELINNMSDAPDKYHHLKIFLHREHINLAPEQYLMIACEDLLDIMFQDGKTIRSRDDLLEFKF